jgi:hypothetical protein
MSNKKTIVILLCLVLLSGGMYLVVQFGFESLLSDAATRLAFQIRDEAAALRRSGTAKRTFAHYPRSWPGGVKGDYRIEIVQHTTAPEPGHRSIGVACTPTGPAWYTTSYHLNFVVVPNDLVVSHRTGEPTMVTLELKDGQVLLTDLQ